MHWFAQLMTLNCDVMDALQQCTEQSKRLIAAQTIICKRGITGDITHMAKRAEHEVTKGMVRYV